MRTGDAVVIDGAGGGDVSEFEVAADERLVSLVCRPEPTAA
jgi:hypothetical protein